MLNACAEREEVYLPEHMKTIKPLKLGGMAGGDKV
jgi:hypothetical protein